MRLILSTRTTKQNDQRISCQLHPEKIVFTSYKKRHKWLAPVVNIFELRWIIQWLFSVFTIESFNRLDKWIYKMIKTHFILFLSRFFLRQRQLPYLCVKLEVQTVRSAWLKANSCAMKEGTIRKLNNLGRRLKFGLRIKMLKWNKIAFRGCSHSKACKSLLCLLNYQFCCHFLCTPCLPKIKSIRVQFYYNFLFHLFFGPLSLFAFVRTRMMMMKPIIS